MTDPNYTAIAIVSDRSGSMSVIRDDAEGGINSLIDDQKSQQGRASLTLVEFDGAVDTVFDFIDIQDATKYSLRPRGFTALLDAWGQTMVSLGEKLAKLSEDERPGNVQFVVVTDGHENASREWTREKINEMVKQQTETYGWNFTFLAANQDAIAVGATFGVSAVRSMSYTASSVGAQSMFRSVSKSVSSTRAGGSGAYSDEDRANAMRGN